MFGELERLALAVTTVSWSDARRVVEVANQQLSRLLGAQMVRLYWDKEAQEGALLEPIAFVNRTGRDDPRAFEIRDQPNGPLSWVYHTGKPLWLEDLEQGAENAVNRIGQEGLDADYLTMQYPCSSMLAVPLRPRLAVRGVYAVELQESGRITDALVDVMSKLAWSLERVLASADTLEFDTQQAGRAIGKFLDEAAGIAIDPVFLTTEVRNCFVARMFDAPFDEVHDRVAVALGGLGVKASSYRPAAGDHVVAEIVDQIKKSHFGVADITANNPNVMFELGVMVSLGKDVLLLKDGADGSEIPYDVAHRAVFRYELRDGELVVASAAGETMPLPEIVASFLDQLDFGTGFASAQPYRPGD